MQRRRTVVLPGMSIVGGIHHFSPRRVKGMVRGGSPDREVGVGRKIKGGAGMGVVRRYG